MTGRITRRWWLVVIAVLLLQTGWCEEPPPPEMQFVAQIVDISGARVITDTALQYGADGALLITEDINKSDNVHLSLIWWDGLPRWQLVAPGEDIWQRMGFSSTESATSVQPLPSVARTMTSGPGKAREVYWA